MSMEISSDILAVREKCLLKFPAPDISTVPINVGEVSREEKWRWKFPATFLLREKMSVEISSVILALRENCTFKTNV